MSSGSGTMRGYSVEARSMYTRPERINGQLFDERWEEIAAVSRSDTGVPRDPIYEPWLSLLNLHSFEAAQALRWWFHAASPRAYFLETRIVEHEVRYEYGSERKREFDVKTFKRDDSDEKEGKED